MAHQTLDHAVDSAYHASAFMTERERVEHLFQRYEQLAAPLAPVVKPKRRKASLKVADNV